MSHSLPNSHFLYKQSLLCTLSEAVNMHLKAKVAYNQCNSCFYPLQNCPALLAVQTDKLGYIFRNTKIIDCNAHQVYPSRRNLKGSVNHSIENTHGWSCKAQVAGAEKLHSHLCGRLLVMVVLACVTGNKTRTGLLLPVLLLILYSSGTFSGKGETK